MEICHVSASNAAEDSVAFPPVKDKNQILNTAAGVATGAATTSTPKPGDDTFSDLKTRKKSVPKDTSILETSVVDPNITMGIPGAATGGGGSKHDDSGGSSGREDSDAAAAAAFADGDENKHPAGIVLKRPQYFTVPPLGELASMTDVDGNCFVENFVVGRHGYGNIFFPGMTNVRGLNLDAIVFFR